MRRSYISFLITATLVCLAVLCPALQAQSMQTPWRNMTQNQLTAVWWQWAFSIPVSISPLFDETGIHAGSGQPYSDLAFLCGTFATLQLENGDVLGKATRSVRLSKGTALFFPLLNHEFDNVCSTPHLGGNCLGATSYPRPIGVPAMQEIVATSASLDIVLYANLTPTDATFHTATGATRDVGFSRLASPPFSYRLPKTDNLYQTAYGLQLMGTVAPAVGDGYFSFIPALAPGYYVLEFGGTGLQDAVSGKKFSQEITYHITVN